MCLCKHMNATTLTPPPIFSLVYFAMLYYFFERNNNINNDLRLLSVYYVETAMQVFITYFHE